MTRARSRFVEYREAYRGAIREAVERLAADVDLDATSLGEMLDYQMATGGKRIRAVLPLMVADCLETAPDKLVPFGAACELIHNATLVHDDLQDGDEVRRNRPAVWAKFGAARAINLGDAILQLAPLALEYVDVDPETRWEIARRMSRRVLAVIEGQQREFESTLREATYREYEEVVAGKTGGLFALAIVESALLCGADSGLVDGLEEAVRPMGVLFQIQDDVLDLYGDKGRSAPGGDLREGKISALVVAFASRAPDPEVRRLRKILEADRGATTAGDVRWAREQFRARGALEASLKRIETLRRRAVQTPGLEGHSSLSGLIEDLIDVVVEPIADLG